MVLPVALPVECNQVTETIFSARALVYEMVRMQPETGFTMPTSPAVSLETGVGLRPSQFIRFLQLLAQLLLRFTNLLLKAQDRVTLMV